MEDILKGKLFIGRNGQDTEIYVLAVIGDMLFCINHSPNHRAFNMSHLTKVEFAMYYDPTPLECFWLDSAVAHFSEE